MIKTISIGIILLASNLVLAEPQSNIFDAEIELARKIVAKQRNDIVFKKMELTVHEEKKFFGVYNMYRDEMRPVLEGQIKLVTDYADTYRNNNLSDKQALNFAKRLLELKGKKIDIRRKYVDIFSKKTSAKYVARFIQLENKLDAIINYDLARNVPLIPISKTKK